MKRILFFILGAVILLAGCENMKNTPTARVEEFLSKYQRLDTDVIEELNNTISKDSLMEEEQKKEYQALLEKQYQNLSYKIKNEEIIDNTATVEVQIEVLDYQTAVKKSKKYFEENPEEFEKSSSSKEKEYIDLKIKEMKEVTTKTKNDIIFHLNNKNGIWYLEELEKSDIAKIHGLYE